MKTFDVSAAQRAQLLRDAVRHEVVARSLREIADWGRPSDFAMSAVPVIEG